jgi:hypothetical protein
LLHCDTGPTVTRLEAPVARSLRRKGNTIALKTSTSARAFDEHRARATRAHGNAVRSPDEPAAPRSASRASRRPRTARFEEGVVSLIARRGRAIDAGDDNAGREAEGGDDTLEGASRLCAREAASCDEIEAAHALVRRRYAWRGYDVPALPDARAPRAQSPVPREVTFVATQDDDTVGTITLGLDGRGGLLAERTHGDAIAERRAAGASVCELTRLAVAETANSRSVLAALFNIAYTVGTAHGVTDVFIEVNPRHVGFYTRVLGFAVAAAEKFCERVQAPSVLLSLAIEELERRLFELDRALAPFGFAARAA